MIIKEFYANDTCEIFLPWDAEFLSVEREGSFNERDPGVVVYAKVNEESTDTRTKRIVMVTTGMKAPEHCRFYGTVNSYHITYHLFGATNPQNAKQSP
jgi:hypothetical protein